MWYRVVSILFTLFIPTLAWATAETLWLHQGCTFNGTGSAYNCAASDGAAGAWNSMANVVMNASDETAGQLDPGDTLKVCGNFTTAERATSNYQLFFTVSGSSSNPITVDGDCSGSGGSTTTDFHGGTSTLYGIGTGLRTDITIKNVTIHDFTSRGLFLYADASADITIDKRITIQDSTITNIRGVGVICVDSRGQHITMTRLTVSACGSDGFHHGGSFFTVQNTSISQISLDSGNDGDGIQTNGDSNGNLYQDNSINMTSVDSKYCIINEGITAGDSVIVRRNVCLRNITDTVGSGFRIEAVGTGTEIYANSIRGGELGIHLTTNSGATKVYGNLIYGQTHEGISIGGASAGSVIVNNNTVVGSGRDGILNSNTGGVVASFTNNIISGAVGDCLDKRAANIEQYNIFYNCGNAVANSNVPTSVGTGTLTTNPLLISTYATSGGSPARQSGISTQPYCIDVRGLACPSSQPDRGSYQSGAGSLAPDRSPATRGLAPARSQR